MSEEIDKLWRDWFMTDAFATEKKFTHFLSVLPHDPRCKFCNAPFHGLGGTFVKLAYGKKQSVMNPRFCNICEDFARTHPGGHEVEMSMLFVDIRGSTALSETMNATEFSRIINRFYVQATDAIVHEDGLVEKLAGDAVAAFWGAGIAGPDYVKRSINAAEKILKIMDHQKIPVGIGVHTGVAYFGAMGSANGIVDISAIGEEVNTAARIASKAGAGELLISEAALKAAAINGSDLESRSLELKGISEPVAVRVIKLAKEQ